MINLHTDKKGYLSDDQVELVVKAAEKRAYQQGYRAGLNRLERYMKRVKMFRKI